MISSNFTMLDQVSEEAHSGEISIALLQSDPAYYWPAQSEFDNSLDFEFNTVGECDDCDLLQSLDSSKIPTSANRDIDAILSQGFDMPEVTQQHSRNMSTYEYGAANPVLFNAMGVSLSQSVAVGISPMLIKISHAVSIIHPLEETFRPRYKSDYFAMNGKKRKPRYVADREGNHFITLKVPVNIRGKIRIDWLTMESSDGERYWMPYRFQASNESTEVPDCNPIYIDTTPDENGLMRVYLVLIKATQNELKSAQPLKLFRPWQDALGFRDSYEKPTSIHMPKDLIQKYQLNKSQLAFTFCSVADDDSSSSPEWDTTAWSTVLTELPPETHKNKVVVKCPNCSTEFALNSSDADSTSTEESSSLKPKMKRSRDTAINHTEFKKQRSLSNNALKIMEG